MTVYGAKMDLYLHPVRTDDQITVYHVCTSFPPCLWHLFTGSLYMRTLPPIHLSRPLLEQLIMMLILVIEWTAEQINTTWECRQQQHPYSCNVQSTVSTYEGVSGNENSNFFTPTLKHLAIYTENGDGIVLLKNLSILDQFRFPV